MHTALVRSLLIDVLHFGSTTVSRRQLAFLLGRQNITANAWVQVVDEWEELGGTRQNLRMLEWGDTFTLLAGPAGRVE